MSNFVSEISCDICTYSMVKTYTMILDRNDNHHTMWWYVNSMTMGDYFLLQCLNVVDLQIKYAK